MYLTSNQLPLSQNSNVSCLTTTLNTDPSDRRINKKSVTEHISTKNKTDIHF